MINRLAIRLAIIGCAATLVVALSAGSAVADDGSAGLVTETATPTQEVRFGPSLEESVLIGVATAPTSGGMTTQSIPLSPQDIFECDIKSNKNHVVWETESWTRKQGSTTLWAGGDLDLRCGSDSTSGYKHIRHRHQYASASFPNAWETVRASASKALGHQAPQPWDSFMSRAVMDTLKNDLIPAVNSAQQKACFAAPFHIWKGGKKFASYYANTVVSKSNYIIITAFLSNNSQASACYNGW